MVMDADSVALSSNTISNINSTLSTISVVRSAPMVALYVIWTDPPIWYQAFIASLSIFMSK